LGKNIFLVINAKLFGTWVPVLERNLLHPSYGYKFKEAVWDKMHLAVN